MKTLLRRYSQVFVTGALGAQSPDLLQERRDLLSAKIVKPIFIMGLQSEPGRDLPYLMRDAGVFQDPCFLYLTGINQKGFALYCYGKTQVLFAPSKSAQREFWEGLHFGIDDADGVADIQALTGISQVLPFEEWPQFLAKELSKKNELYSHLHNYQSADGAWKQHKNFSQGHQKTLKAFLKKQKLNTELKCLSQVQLDLRLPICKLRLKDIRAAQKRTGQGFEKLLGVLPTLKTESEASYYLESHIKTPQGMAFPIIAASGANACVLHYTKNDEPFTKKSLLLLDFGSRVGTQHADISRTIPVNGSFNPLQALLYQIVLDAQIAVEGQVKPGKTILEIDAFCWKYLDLLLQERFFAIGGKAEQPYTIKPHGVSHFIGEEEHDGDPLGLYRQKPLQVGHYLSNEPGLYGHFSVKLGGKRYSESIGIRIEDGLIVTAKGCQNVSKAIPKTISELEHVLQK